MITPEFSFRFVLRCLTSYIGYVLSFCEAKYAKPLLEVPYIFLYYIVQVKACRDSDCESSAVGIQTRHNAVDDSRITTS